MAVKAPWPVAEEEDKVLTRQSAFLQSSLKSFRAQEGKAKKGWTKASVVVTDSYPQWKVDALLWMQEQYKASGNKFLPSLMGDLKKWTASNISDKKLMKNVMQFVSFTMKEVEDVGEMAMDVKLPFDQMSVLESSEAYLKAQLNIENLDFIKLDGDDAAAASVPERVQGNVTPGKPSLWMR
jgi:leucyl-tRNA synthetase